MAGVDDRPRLEAAIAALDAANAEDPNREIAEGQEHPKELLYARRMSGWLERLEPGASEALRLAVRAQHIRRWSIPRRSYPMDRAGYRRWRTELARFHAETAGAILRSLGYEESLVSRVQALLRKEGLRTDPEAQTLEDVACLVFLESYFADFSRQHDETKILDIVRKVWRKMSERGRERALGLPMQPQIRGLVEKALGRAGP